MSADPFLEKLLTTQGVLPSVLLAIYCTFVLLLNTKYNIMKTLNAFFTRLFTSSNEQYVCDNCSYYDDHTVDDREAFVPHVKSQQGWIAEYVRRTFHTR